VAPISMALTCRVEEPSTASQPDSCGAANSDCHSITSSARASRVAILPDIFQMTGKHFLATFLF
jgi:hypothetical protein